MKKSGPNRSGSGSTMQNPKSSPGTDPLHSKLTLIDLDSEVIPVTGRRGLYGCETSRIPHFLDNRFTEGGEVVRLTRRPRLIPQEDSWYSFLLEDESTPG
jgi:hypothetical protein